MATVTATAAITTSTLQNTGTVLRAENMNIVEAGIETEVGYLIKDSKHENEKPYELRYDPEGIIPSTNMANESKSIIVHSFRPLENSHSFEEYGFSSAKIECALTAADVEDEKKVEEVYYPEIEKLLWQKFPDADEIKILEHGLRKRHMKFPAVEGEIVEFTQPATLVHIDYSPYSAGRSAQAAFKKAPNRYRRLLTVNLWKSFQGPGNDWPLALCDWRTIDYSMETMPADVVFFNRFSENERLHYSPKHEWYYFKDLCDDEVILIRQTDSDLEGGGGVAHASFYNPRADENAAPRMSLELRAFLFFI